MDLECSACSNVVIEVKSSLLSSNFQGWKGFFSVVLKMSMRRELHLSERLQFSSLVFDKRALGSWLVYTSQLVVVVVERCEEA